MKDQLLYTVPEVAQILRCNPRRVYDLNKAGLLPLLKLGQLKCRRETLIAFLEKYDGYDVSDPYNVTILQTGTDDNEV
ncbi:helix-turn-helix domain-containing protein [Anaerotignum lactatifermentans]|uniref:helix-turn-helix domain-containing protein n=1 Tax=Anaerotignum lactatifermentans TaxID=160404 RepID=UPI00266CEB56|nr:helix-turn-helix domain-containing protein [Anaerotignum lactatifermentans]